MRASQYRDMDGVVHIAQEVSHDDQRWTVCERSGDSPVLRTSAELMLVRKNPVTCIFCIARGS